MDVNVLLSSGLNQHSRPASGDQVGDAVPNTLLYERDDLGFIRRMLCIDQSTGSTPQGESSLSLFVGVRFLGASQRSSDSPGGQGASGQSRAEKTPSSDVA